MSDGEPTDSGIWEHKLEWINQNNKWFRYATKIGIAIDEESDKKCLAKIVGNPEAVISVNDHKTLKTLIKVASLSISVIGSKSRTTADGENAIDIINQTRQMLDDPDNIQIGLDDTDPWDNWDDQSSSDPDNNNWGTDDDDWN